MTLGRKRGKKELGRKLAEGEREKNREKEGFREREKKPYENLIDYLLKKQKVKHNAAEKPQQQLTYA